MKKQDFIKLIRECMQEMHSNPSDVSSDEGNEEELSIKHDILKQIAITVKEFKAGEKIEPAEIKYTAEDEQMDPSRLYVSDVLFERIKNVFYNHQQMKAVTYMGVNAPAVKDSIIQKLGDNPLAMTVGTEPAKGMDRYDTSSELGDELVENLKKSLKKLIVESLEEIKEDKKKDNIELMEDLESEIKKTCKSVEIEKNNANNYSVTGCGDHSFDIRPMWDNNFDVVYFKNKTIREKKLNLSFDDLKDFVKNKLAQKGDYVVNAFNKSAENQKDQTEKGDLPKHDILTRKEVTDKKNDNKDYNERAVTNDDDLPDKPMAVVAKIKKLSDHPVKGEKAKYEYPSKSDNKVGKKAKTPHVEKFKGKKLKA